MLFTRFCVGLVAGCFLNATHAFAEDESLKPKQVVISMVAEESAVNAMVPADLTLAIIEEVSDFDSSKVGAQGQLGLLQLNPGIMRSRYGVTTDLLANDGVSLHYGTLLLSDLYRENGFDWDRAVGAYFVHHVAPKDVSLDQTTDFVADIAAKRVVWRKNEELMTAVSFYGRVLAQTSTHAPQPMRPVDQTRAREYERASALASDAIKGCPRFVRYCRGNRDGSTMFYGYDRTNFVPGRMRSISGVTQYHGSGHTVSEIYRESNRLRQNFRQYLVDDYKYHIQR